MLKTHYCYKIKKEMINISGEKMIAIL